MAICPGTSGSPLPSSLKLSSVWKNSFPDSGRIIFFSCVEATFLPRSKLVLRKADIRKKKNKKLSTVIVLALSKNRYSQWNYQVANWKQTKRITFSTRYMIKLWNSLPEDVVKVQWINVFKKELSKFMEDKFINGKWTQRSHLAFPWVPLMTAWSGWVLILSQHDESHFLECLICLMKYG